MLQTVLVIDSNSAVQAITALALNQTECTVETLADGSEAYKRISALKPTVVLCAKEIAGVDPFELCKKVKSELKRTAFVLLAPADGMKNTSARAKESDYDEVIFKPFKSNRLREVVTELMNRQLGPTESPKTFLLSMDDPVREKLIRRLLEHCGAKVVNGMDATGWQAAVIEWGKTTLTPLKDDRELFVLAPSSALGEVTSAHPHARLIPVPLHTEELFAAFSGLITRPDPYVPLVDESHGASGPAGTSHPTSQSQGDAHLAADIAAAVFRTLLTAPPMQTGVPEDAAELAREAALKAAKNFQRK